MSPKLTGTHYFLEQTLGNAEISSKDTNGAVFIETFAENMHVITPQLLSAMNVINIDSLFTASKHTASLTSSKVTFSGVRVIVAFDGTSQSEYRPSAGSHNARDVSPGQVRNSPGTG